MRSETARLILFATLATALGLLTIAPHVWAEEKVVHVFRDSDGSWPSGYLISGVDGSFYGTTSLGGDLDCPGYEARPGCGTVFRLTPGADGQWTETVLYSFAVPDDGVAPTGLVFDAAGSLYGTTFYGGDFSACADTGCGTVFKLTPGVNGWTKTTLLSFNFKDGAAPSGALIFDSEGNLYGATGGGGNTTACGAAGCGTVFKLAPGTNGKWTHTVLRMFQKKDGAGPNGLVFDQAGNLYGTTLAGNPNVSCVGGCGTVFKLAPGANGEWTHTILHSFQGKDGAAPCTALTIDAGGNLYGTTASGVLGYGAVFELTLGANGDWVENVIHAFNGKDGRWPGNDVFPGGGLILDAAGNLYGTTPAGGDSNLTYCGSDGCGIVYKLTPGENGEWTETVLHWFDNTLDGVFPQGGLLLDAAGHLYGGALAGKLTGACGTEFGCGVIFEIAP